MTILFSPKALQDDLSKPEILLSVMQQLRQSLSIEGRDIFTRWSSLIQRPDFRDSAQNLADYLALRHHDLRSLQTALMPWGLSSLGCIESRVMPNLDAVIATLGNICRKDQALLPAHPPLAAFFEGSELPSIPYLQQIEASARSD